LRIDGHSSFIAKVPWVTEGAVVNRFTLFVAPEFALGTRGFHRAPDRAVMTFLAKVVLIILGALICAKVTSRARLARCKTCLELLVVISTNRTVCLAKPVAIEVELKSFRSTHIRSIYEARLVKCHPSHIGGSVAVATLSASINNRSLTGKTGGTTRAIRQGFAFPCF
jgi:hypothetical protein